MKRITFNASNIEICDRDYPNLHFLSSALEEVIRAFYLDDDRDIEVVRPLIEQLLDSVLQELL